MYVVWFVVDDGCDGSWHDRGVFGGVQVDVDGGSSCFDGVVEEYLGDRRFASVCGSSQENLEGVGVGVLESALFHGEVNGQNAVHIIGLVRDVGCIFLMGREGWGGFRQMGRGIGKGVVLVCGGGGRGSELERAAGVGEHGAGGGQVYLLL